MSNILAVSLIALGVVALVAGVGSIILRRRLAKNTSQANILGRFGDSASAFVVVLGMMQLGLGALFLSLSVVIPQRFGETGLNAFTAAILGRMGGAAPIFTLACLMSGIIFVILGVAILQRANNSAKSPDLGPDKRKISFRRDVGYISSTIALTYGVIAIGTGVVFSTVLISGGGLG